MKRGTELERILAYAGTGGWVLLMVLNGLSPFSIGVGGVGVIMSVHEFRRWQRWERIASGSREGRHVYPRWAWFGAGSVLATFAVGVGYGAYLVIVGRPLVEDDPAVILLGIVAWIAGGLTAQRLLLRFAERREAAERAAFVPLPPPPPRAPQAPGPADDRTERRPEIPTPDRPARPQDPRGRF